jgi:hypothetical protein
MEVLEFGGTDAGAIHLTKAGSPVWDYFHSHPLYPFSFGDGGYPGRSKPV